MPIIPLFTTNFDFSKSVTISILQSNAWLIDTNSGSSATISIGGNNNGNEWVQFVTDTPFGLGAAYIAVSNRLLLSVNFPNGTPNNFDSLGTIAAPWRPGQV